MKQEDYDVVIVGAGPAGVFAALGLCQDPKLRIAILDKGRDIDQRHCPIQESGTNCHHCQPCAILNGWGGAGAFSDGKLTLSPAVGGHLAQILGEQQASRLLEEVDQSYLDFGAPDLVHGAFNDEIEALEKRAVLASLRFISVPIRHIGTERCVHIMRAIRDHLLQRGVDIHMRTPVTRILTQANKATGVETEGGERIGAGIVYRYIVDILEMIHALDQIAPGVASPHTLLYGVEVKFYSNRLLLSPEMETELENLFACGDGAGVTRGLMQASAAGLTAARAIHRRLASRLGQID